MVFLMRTLPFYAAALLLCSIPLPAQAGWDEGVAAWARKDWTTAAQEFQPLAQAGHVGALSRLGHMTLQGQGVAKNEAEALRLLRAAAEKGDMVAQNSVGNMYFKGLGTERDGAQAALWFGRAADQGYARAENNLGQLYLYGNGVPKDEAKGLPLLRRAADKNIPAAWEALGMAAWNGHGMQADHAEAVRWFRKAAERGLLLAQNRLGSALWNGDGTAKDAVEAVKWFEQAAAQGDGSSLFNLSIAALHGIGMARDNEKAALYAILAARFAKPNDKTRFDDARDKARARISDEHWARAEATARTWVPKAINPDSEPIIVKIQPSPTAPARPQSSAGSGIVVSRDGIVLTNSHVVAQCRNIRITLDGTPAIAATVVARDAANDLAALKASFRPTSVARFREDKPLRSGDAIVAIGYPLSSLLSREPNVTAGLISAMAGLRGDPRSYQITAPVQKGNSGGPLADMSGNVVGIVSAKLNAMKIANSTGDLPQNVNFAIKAELARKFLADNSIPFDTAPAKTTLSPADVGDIVKKVTVFVECEG